jgi:exosortase/archaeosortase family protein
VAVDDGTAVAARAPARSNGVALALRAAVYVALVVGLSNLLLVGALDRAVLAQLRRAIAFAAAAVLSLFRSDVRAIGEHVAVGGAVIEIVNGCTGLDVGIFLASAVLVFPAPWRARLRGVALAFAVALGLNFLRVLTLCWLISGFPMAFEVVHSDVWPVAISLACLATLFAWIRTTPAADV